MQAQRAGILQARQLVALRTDAPVDADDLLKKRAPRLAEVPPPLPEETERMPDDTKEKHAEWRQVPEPEEPEPETTAEREQQSGPVVIDAQGEPVDVDPIEVRLTDDGTPDVRVAGAPRRTSGALALTESPEWTLALEPKGMNQAVWLAEKLAPQFPDLGGWHGCLCVILMGREMGLPAMGALLNYKRVKGRFAPSWQLLAACIVQHPACEYLRLVRSDADGASFVTKRRGSPEVPYTYTIEMAQRAGLVRQGERGDSAWISHPEAMCRKMCVVHLGRIVFPDNKALGLYFPDEIAA
jgi:hypothetical protein